MEQERRKWHLDRNVSIVHIITTMITIITVVVGSITVITDMDARISLLEYKDEKQQQFNTKIEDYFDNILKKLEDITEKFATHQGEHNGNNNKNNSNNHNHEDN